MVQCGKRILRCLFDRHFRGQLKEQMRGAPEMMMMMMMRHALRVEQVERITRTHTLAGPEAGEPHQTSLEPPPPPPPLCPHCEATGSVLFSFLLAAYFPQFSSVRWNEGDFNKL